MVERQVRVVNTLGIHARPASMIVQTANRFNSTLHLVKDGVEADSKSIMSVMMLAAAFNSTVTIRANGDDETAAAEAIAKLFADKFKEE